MNTSHGMRNILAAACIVALSGCLEIDTTTTVHPDGSLRRVVRTKGDSAEVCRRKQIFATDSTWNIVRHKTDSTWESIATRDYPDAFTFDMDANKGGERSLRVRVSLEKQFAWFTTSFEYRETILCYNQFHAVPITDLIPQNDVDLWLRHEVDGAPFASIEDSLKGQVQSGRGEEWDRRNKFKAYHTLFLEGARSLNDRALSTVLVPASEETLFVRTLKHMNAGSLDSLPAIYQAVLKSPSVQKVFDLQHAAFTAFEEKLAFQEEMLSAGYTHASIEMPGLITGTNARSIEGNRLTWKEFMGACYVTDYTMWARSRVINWWAVILTGAVVLFLAAIPLVWLVRRRTGLAERV
jgi:hypothetical protein